MEPAWILTGLAIATVAGYAIRALSRRKRPHAPAPQKQHNADAAASPLDEPRKNVLDVEPKQRAPQQPPITDPPSSAPKNALMAGLSRTRSGITATLSDLFGRQQVHDEVFEQLEEALILSDVGTATTQKVIEGLRRHSSDTTSGEALQGALRKQLLQLLNVSSKPVALDQRPSVVLVVGVNGVGKTTTIGKVASVFAKQGKRVALVAGDTFRAAALPQLEAWGRRVGCPVFSGKPDADPSSVIYDAISKSKQTGDAAIDVLIVDTAGRLHTQGQLMSELAKIARTIEKALGRPADEVWLVVDATTGNNALKQAELFGQAATLTGLITTKLDGTAKGGILLGIVDKHQLPVRYVGIGEGLDDLIPFDPEDYIEALIPSQDD